MKDAFGGRYEAAAFAPLFSARGRPAEAPWRLALVTLLPFAEGLSDRQAAAAGRRRIDWTYVLSLELTDTGLDASVLGELRVRLLAGGAEGHLFAMLLEPGRARRWLKARGRERPASTQVLAAIRALNRLEGAGETMRQALNVLAVVAPEWLRQHSPPDWLDRYGPRLEDFRLPTSKEERQVLLAEVEGGIVTRFPVLADEEAECHQGLPAIHHHRAVFGRSPWLVAEDRRLHTKGLEDAARGLGVAHVVTPRTGRQAECCPAGA